VHAPKTKSNKHKETIAPLTNPSQSFTHHHTPNTQKRHLYPSSCPTFMYTQTISGYKQSTHPTVAPVPTLPPLSRGTDKDLLTPLTFSFFPVQSRGTESPAAVQGGHHPRGAWQAEGLKPGSRRAPLALSQSSYGHTRVQTDARHQEPRFPLFLRVEHGGFSALAARQKRPIRAQSI